MRDYLAEIKILEKEIEAINDEVSIISLQLNNFEVAIYTTKHKTFSGLTLEQAYEKDPDLLDAYFRSIKEYDRLKEERAKLYDERRCKLHRKEELKEEYLRLHTCDFYRPMDEIDICNLISKDGYIVGVKFWKNEEVWI